MVGPLKERYTAMEALAKLLTTAGFSFRWNGLDAVDVLSVSNSAVADSPDPKGPPAPAAKRAPQPLERVVVSAGRIFDATSLPPPVLSFDRERIERSGATTVPDLLKQITQQPYTRPEGFHTSGAQFAALRGLGPDMTLVLINGRRTLSSASTLTTNAFDLNTIPLTAVDRVEILLDSASATYGADAIGGLVNIVLRQDIPGPSVDVHYGSAEGGGTQRRASFSAGYQKPNADATLVLDYLDSDALLGAQRDRYRNQDFSRFGGTDWRFIESAPGNITSLLPGNLPGLPAPIAAVPRGPRDSNVTTEDFLATAGQRNLESLFRYISVVPEVRQLSALASGQIALTQDLFAYGEVMHINRSLVAQMTPPLLLGVTIPASNAFNPFGVPVIANAMLAGIAPTKRVTEGTLSRAVIGLHDALSTWNWDVAALSTDDRASTWTDNLLNDDRIATSLAQSDPNQAVDSSRGSAQRSNSAPITTPAPSGRTHTSSDSGR